MENILPVKYPLIDYAQPQSTQLAILESHEDDFEKHSQNWIYSNYIDLVYSEKLDFIEFLPFFEDNFFSSPYLTTTIISREIIKRNYIDSIDFLKRSIDLEQYIYGMVNFKHIAKSQGQNYFHQLFIFGYDEEENVFHVGDFLFGTKYCFTTVPFEDIRSAIDDIREEEDDLTFGGGLLLISYNSNGKKLYQGLNISHIISSLTKFMNAQNPMDRYDSKFYYQQPLFTTYGIDIYKSIIERNLDLNKYWDKRIAYAIYSHKKLMKMRLEYLADNTLISNVLCESFNGIFELSQRLVSLFLKANMVDREKKYAIVQKIKVLLTELYRQEKDFYPKLIISLEAHVN